MMPRYRRLHALYARLAQLMRPSGLTGVTTDQRDVARTCKDLAFWSASDAGLSGPIEAFDGSLLHRAADGLLTVRMTLRDSLAHRSPAEAASIVGRSLDGFRVLLLLEIDGRRFVKLTTNVNAGVREWCDSFTSRRESTG